MNSARRRPLLALTALSVLALAACHKKKPEAPTVSESTPPAAAAAPAAAQAPALSEEQQALADKKKAVADALAEDTLINDPKGQWVVAATCDSDDENKEDSYGSKQVIGKPDVVSPGIATGAWGPEKTASGIRWLKADFATPVHAATIRVRQNSGLGGIIKIELLDDSGSSHTIWTGIDDTKYEPNHIGWLQKSFDATPYLVKSAKITVNTNMTDGALEIDAIQLVSQ